MAEPQAGVFIMITTFLKWSPDISQAPRGEMVTSTYQMMVKGKPQEVSKTEHQSTKILVLTNCGKVVPTYWIPSREASGGAILGGNRWSGLATGEEPVLWAPWPNAAELAATYHAMQTVAPTSAAELLDHAECDA